MESTANLMIFCGICRKFDKFHGKQQNAMANLETGNSATKFEVDRSNGLGGDAFTRKFNI